MTAALTALLIIAAAVGAVVCLCRAMSRGKGDRPCPVRPVPPRRPTGPAVWKDPGPIEPDAPWRDPLAGALIDGIAFTEAELRAAVGVSRRYPEAYRHLLADALAAGPEHPASAPDGADHTAPADLSTTPHASWLDRSPQVAEATEGGTP